MTRDEAIALIRPAVGEAAGTWADFGAGQGLFTEALAAILGDGGRVLAVEREPRALEALLRLPAHRPGAGIVVVAGDFLHLGSIPALRDLPLDGALFANALHYVAEPESVLEPVARLLRPGGRLVVIEYDRTASNPWVPYPLPAERLRRVVARAGFAEPSMVGRRRSRYQGEMYCAVASLAPPANQPVHGARARGSRDG